MSNLHICAFDHIIDDDRYIDVEKISVLEECIISGVNINHNSSNSLCSAIHKKSFPIVEFLINAGAEINSNVICSAVLSGYDMVKYLVDKGAMINPDDYISLNTAISEKNYAIVKLLIDKGINVRTNDDIALYISCMGDNLEIIELLLQSGADANSKKNKITNIDNVCKNVNFLKLLVKYGFDLNIHSNILMISACRNNKIDIVEYLISMGTNCADSDAIVTAYRYHSDLKLRRLLLENGANTNHIINYYKYNMSLLEYSAVIHSSEDCKLLLEFGADVNKCHNFIPNAYLDMKKGADKLEKIIELFMEYGLDISNVFEEK